MSRLEASEHPHRATQKEIDDCYGLEQWALTGFTDYVFFSAEKPA